MSYEQTISEVVKVVEVAGAGIMVFGGLGAFVVFAARAVSPARAHESYEELRRNLGRSILLGLEVLIVADIVRTIIVDPTIESVVVLGVIVLIQVEIDGVWPWRRSRLDPHPERRGAAGQALGSADHQNSRASYLLPEPGGSTFPSSTPFERSAAGCACPAVSTPDPAAREVESPPRPRRMMAHPIAIAAPISGPATYTQ